LGCRSKALKPTPERRGVPLLRSAVGQRTCPEAARLGRGSKK
jgi:hypothetical protein